MYANFQVPVNTLPQNNDVLRIRHRSSIPVALQSYECHFNWAKSFPLTLPEMGHGLLLLEEKFRDEAREIHTLLKLRSASTGGISLISKKLSQAYFNIESSKFSEAKVCLSDAEKFLELCVNDYYTLTEEYAQGFKYVLDGLQVFLEMQVKDDYDRNRGRGRGGGTTAAGKSGDNSNSNLGVGKTSGLNLSTNKVILDGMKHFRKLPAKGKYIVWTVKDVFYMYCSRSNVQRADWMEKILEMEPHIPKWHFYLYKALHGTRKLRPRPMPLGQEEKPASEDPLSISYFTMCLAQMLGEKNQKHITSPSSSQYPCWFGKIRFETPLEILTTIQEKTVKVLEMDCHLDGVYLNFSEIHMFLLPPEHRNIELGMRCLKKALRLNNTNARTHYRMGLALFKLKNHKQATHHFRSAIKDPSNIGAVVGLLQMLMGSPVKNSTEIHSILTLGMKHRELIRVWDRRCLRTLHYLKGCFHFMMEKEEESLNEAITSWIIAHDNESPKWSYYFLNLSHQCARFEWPTKRLNLTNVSNALKHAAYLEQTQFKQLLLDICSEVDDALRREEENSERKTSSSSSSSTSTNIGK
ncbi:unnamed protein product [Orchesella dallaii]|uniref:Uncharacterized protein n=1 Tax=Orchesella dallaii TaxID=48710 RepID=A0ABP1S1U0_9HEXA